MYSASILFISHLTSYNKQQFYETETEIQKEIRTEIQKMNVFHNLLSFNQWLYLRVSRLGCL
jgi:hypothetical protein